MVVNADLSKLLDKQYEDMKLADLLNAPVAALAGITDKDGELLQQALNIKTVGDLGRNKFFRAAAALVALAESGK